MVSAAAQVLILPNERRYHIPRRTTYSLLDKKCMPSLELVAKACLAIKQEAARK